MVADEQNNERPNRKRGRYTHGTSINRNIPDSQMRYLQIIALHIR
jgi:hypothetical protein